MAEFAVHTVAESGEMNGSQNPDQSQEQTDTSATNPAKPGDSIFASKEKDDPAKIFVGGLNACTTNDTLSNYFSTFGTVIDASVKYTHPQDGGMGNLRDPNDPGTRSRGFGFVLFESADVALEVLNQQHIVDDKVIEVKKAVRQGQSKSKKLFVGGLANFISEEILNAYFSAFGAILETKIIIDHVTQRRRGFAFIQFEDESTVDTIATVRYHDLTSAGETCKVEVKPVLPNSKPPGQGGFRGGRGGFRGDGRRGGFRGRGGYNQQQGGDGNYNQWGGGYNQGGGRGGYSQGQDQSGYQQGSYYQGSYDQSGYNQPQYDQSYQNYQGYNYNYGQGYGQEASTGQYSNGSGYPSGYQSGYNTENYGDSAQQYNYGSNYGQEASSYGKAQGSGYQQQSAYQPY